MIINNKKNCIIFLKVLYKNKIYNIILNINNT